jgi:hypothetical protein
MADGRLGVGSCVVRTVEAGVVGVVGREGVGVEVVACGVLYAEGGDGGDTGVLGVVGRGDTGTVVFPGCVVCVDCVTVSCEVDLFSVS